MALSIFQGRATSEKWANRLISKLIQGSPEKEGYQSIVIKMTSNSYLGQTVSASSSYAYLKEYEAFDGKYTSGYLQNIGWLPSFGSIAKNTWLEIDGLVASPDIAILTYGSNYTGRVEASIQAQIDGLWTDISDHFYLEKTSESVPISAITGSNKIEVTLRKFSQEETANLRVQFFGDEAISVNGVTNVGFFQVDFYKKI